MTVYKIAPQMEKLAGIVWLALIAIAVILVLRDAIMTFRLRQKLKRIIARHPKGKKAPRRRTG